jgi:TRAP-type C4-dicarboxylate transport system substrate-binding protein
MDQRSNVPLIQQLNAQADDWRSAELARAMELGALSGQLGVASAVVSARASRVRE